MLDDDEDTGSSEFDPIAQYLNLEDDENKADPDLAFVPGTGIRTLIWLAFLFAVGAVCAYYAP